MAEKVTLETIDERLMQLLERADREAKGFSKRDPEIWAMMEEGVRGLLELRNQYNMPNPELQEMVMRLFPINPVQEWLDAKSKSA